MRATVMYGAGARLHDTRAYEKLSKSTAGSQDFQHEPEPLSVRS
jgi:hypothetical protein